MTQKIIPAIQKESYATEKIFSIKFRELSKTKMTMIISHNTRFRIITIFYCLIIVVIVCSTPSYSQKKKKQATLQVTDQRIKLTNEDGFSKYRIILPSTPTESESKAANILQDYLIQISGAVLPIIGAEKARSSYEIVLGQNDRIDELGLNINYNELQQDGFLIKTDSARLIIAGGSGKGTIYGVYTLLEKYLNCRMYTPSARVIPKQKQISLDKIDDKQIPSIRFRSIHYKSTWDAEYVDWHKLSHDENGERKDWGMWVHTFNALVPPEIYFDNHQEYFALVDGKRLPTQLCLTNPDVLKITIQNLRKKIAQNPAALYWSVSQNDNKRFCTCDNCKAIDEREGSPSGSIIQFVNQVADEFPDKIISTLAYEYGRKAPKTLKPRPNVNIMLCSIEAFRHLPITEDSASADFVKDVEDWGKIARDIIVWDYVIQFTNLISPFPNLHVLQPNIQFFVKNGVTAMFEQGNREVGGEFSELRSYLLAKLLWDPDMDVNVLMNDFLNGYYGNAGPYIRKYIDTMQEAQKKSALPLRIFGNPNEEEKSFLSTELIDTYNAIIDDAEKSVADSAELLERVRIARLPVSFAMMEQAKKQYIGDRGVFHKVNGQWEARPEFRSMIGPFTDLCIRQGVTRVKEWCTTPEEYRASTYRILALGMKEHLAYGKKVIFVSPDSITLKPSAATILTDGKRGGHEYDYNWFGTSGKDLEVIIDLGSEQTIRRIESSYYHFAYWRTIAPTDVEYFISTDGKVFNRVGENALLLPIDQYGGFQRDVIAEFVPQQARYVKLLAHSIGNTPDWHPGAGQPANMLIDEIVVE
jgi:hypothetical protein